MSFLSTKFSLNVAEFRIANHGKYQIFLHTTTNKNMNPVFVMDNVV